MKENEKRKKVIKSLLITLGVLVILLIITGVYLWTNVSKIWGDLGFDENTVVDEYETDADANSLPEVTFNEGDIPIMEKSNGNIDIILIGVDNRDSTKFTGRSDVTMYLRIDTNQQKLKLASFMRDTLVEIEGHGKNKINTAFNFGSIELTKQTFNKSFGLTSDYFMVVNFYGMEDIIDVLGGVDINIESNEIKYLTASIKELNKIDKDNKSPEITKSGTQHLNGRQAVAYMRIRKIGGDAMRIQRQQTVLNELFKKANNIDIGQVPALINVLSQYIRTDIPLNKMLDIATVVKGMQVGEMGKFSYPEEYEVGRYKGMSIVQPKDSTIELEKLHNFIKD